MKNSINNKHKILFILFFLLNFNLIFSQNTFKALVKNEKSQEAITNVSVFLEGTQNVSTTNEKGFIIIENLPDL